MKVTEHLIKINRPGRIDANRSSDRVKQGEEYTSPLFSEKKRTHKLNNKCVHRSISENLETLSFMIHGAGNSSDE